MIEAMEAGHQLSDVFYIWRLRELVVQGRIECEGELPGREHDRGRKPNAMLRIAPPGFGLSARRTD